MEVRFTQTPADSWNLYKSSLWRSPALLLQLSISLLILPLLAFLVSMIALSLNTSLLIAGGVALVWVFRILTRMKSATLKRASEQFLCGRPALAQITPEELRFSHESLILRLSWPSIIKIEETNGLLCFYRAPVLAYLIPCRAFGDPSQKEAFLKLAQSYFQSTRSNSDVNPVSFQPMDATAETPIQMSVAFERTLDDLAHTTRVTLPAATGVRAGARYLATVLFFVGGLYWVWLGMRWSHEGSSSLSVWSLAGLYLVWGIHMLWSRSQWRIRSAVRSLVKAMPGVLGHVDIAIDPRWYTIQAPLVFQSVAWDLIHKVAEDGGYIYVYETPRSISAIPKRAFDSDRDAQEFFHAARGYWQQAKSGALVNAPVEGVWPPAPHVRS